MKPSDHPLYRHDLPWHNPENIWIGTGYTKEEYQELSKDAEPDRQKLKPHERRYYRR